MCIVLQSRAHAARRSARFLPSTRRWRRSHSRCRFPRRRRSPSSTLVAGSRRSAYRMASTCNNKAARTSGSTAETKGSSGMGLASGGRKAQRLGSLRNAARTSSAGSGQKHVVLGRQASRSPTLHTAHGGQFWWGCHARHLMMTGLPTCARRLQREVVSVGGGIAAAWCLQHIAAHPRLRSGRHRACPHRRCQRCRTVAVAAQRPPPMCLPAQRLRKSALQCLPPRSLPAQRLPK